MGDKMEKQSHLAALHRNDDICIIASTLPDSISMYFYVRLNKHKQKQFFADMEKLPALTLTDYGEILESGIGETPSDESIVKMMRNYNYQTPELA